MKSNLWLNRSLLLFAILLIFVLVFQVLAIKIQPEFDNGIQFIVGNETYTFSSAMDFDSITIASSYIVFDSTAFYISSPNDIKITLNFVKTDSYQVPKKDLVLQFYANTNTGNVLFDISGFSPGSEYEVRRDNTVISNPIADISGFISFSNNVWSSHMFSVYKVTYTDDDVSPILTNIVLTSSSSKDTNPAFGWENITCGVTDNGWVDQVKVNIIYPSGEIINVSMNHILGTNNYYYNTSFSEFGIYNYYIWVMDTSGNWDISSNKIFSLPPNWDINSDGLCSILDLTLVSNRYNDFGNPGWIRADVDNSGKINVLDLILISNHYDEIWS